MTFVAISGVRGGRSTGLSAAAGNFVGCLGHILFAVFGLSALIAASQAAFAVLKWLGVAYLVYLAYQLLRAQERATIESTHAANYAPASAFRQAALVNLLNSKVGIFFLAFLPQFIEPGIASPWQQILALGLLFNATGAIVNSLIALISTSAARRFSTNPSYARAARWFAATVLGGLAARLALSRP